MKKKTIINSLLIFLLFIVSPNFLFSQIYINRNPRSMDFKELKKIENLPLITLPVLDTVGLLESKINDQEPLQFAKAFDVDIDVKREGQLEILNNNYKIWRLRIKSSNAYSLNMTCEDFLIPQGAELYFYNVSKSQVLGPFTEKNNLPSRILPIPPIKGDEIVIEYMEPFFITFEGIVKITRIGHDYLGILNQYIDVDGRFGTSQWCNIDINCPEGIDWQNEKQSVSRLLINNTGYCSGALINNVTLDGIPYVLTAEHCINSNSDANNTVFVFNYESHLCEGDDGSTNQFISGAIFRAAWPGGADAFTGTDFSLVELSSTPPNSYNIYYSGWNRAEDVPSTPVFCIHHPSGDVKKITRNDDDPELYNTYFWEINDYTFGTIEPGSSGGPFYNSNRRIVGHISQALRTYCNSVESSLHGTFSGSWNGGNTDATRLRNWLDPNNTTNELPGLRYIRNINIFSTKLYTGDIVKFENVNISVSTHGRVGNVVAEFEDRFEAIGEFSAIVGTTLEIRPKQ